MHTCAHRYAMRFLLFYVFIFILFYCYWGVKKWICQQVHEIHWCNCDHISSFSFLLKYNSKIKMLFTCLSIVINSCLLQVIQVLLQPYAKFHLTYLALLLFCKFKPQRYITIQKHHDLDNLALTLKMPQSILQMQTLRQWYKEIEQRVIKKILWKWTA